ncbi:MAG: site-specific integrase, partial [Bacteroidia bacterium]
MSNWNLFIKSFEMYLSAERSFSKNSVQAYLRDIKGLATFMEEEFPKVTPQKTELKHLQAYIKQINEFGLSASSQGRILSGIRAFFKFLVIEKETGKVIGKAGFHNWYAMHQRAELGYALNDDSHKN